jgi:hypothetical protein
VIVELWGFDRMQYCREYKDRRFCMNDFEMSFYKKGLLFERAFFIFILLVRPPRFFKLKFKQDAKCQWC